MHDYKNDRMCAIDPARKLEIAIRNRAFVEVLPRAPAKFEHTIFAPHVLYRSSTGEMLVHGYWVDGSEPQPGAKYCDLPVAQIYSATLTLEGRSKDRSPEQPKGLNQHPAFDPEAPQFRDRLCPPRQKSFGALVPFG